MLDEPKSSSIRFIRFDFTPCFNWLFLSLFQLDQSMFPLFVFFFADKISNEIYLFNNNINKTSRDKQNPIENYDRVKMWILTFILYDFTEANEFCKQNNREHFDSSPKKKLL